MSSIWNENGELLNGRFVCKNDDTDVFIVCGGQAPDADSDSGNRYFQVNAKGGYTGRWQDGSAMSANEKEWAYDHASGGCCGEPQCAICLEYADIQA